MLLAVNYRTLGFNENAIRMCLILIKETSHITEEDSTDMLSISRAAHIFITLIYLS